MDCSKISCNIPIDSIIGYDIIITNHVFLPRIRILTDSISSIIISNIIGNNHIVTNNTAGSVSGTINNPVSISSSPTIIKYSIIRNGYAGAGMPTLNTRTGSSIDNVIDNMTTLIRMVDTMDIVTSSRPDTGNKIAYLIIIVSILLVGIVT